jgi:1,4-alpha-glucan branching enzyme
MNDGWLCDSILKMAARPSPMSTAPAFSPGPCRTCGPPVGSVLRCTRELIALRWRFPALRSEGYALIHVHDENRVLAFQRWIPGEGGDVVIVLSFANETKYGYEIGFPSGGHWHEVFNSDVFQNWVNPRVQGNGGGVDASGPPRHGLPNSAALTLPANALLVFAR